MAVITWPSLFLLGAEHCSAALELMQVQLLGCPTLSGTPASRPPSLPSTGAEVALVAVCACSQPLRTVANADAL